MKSTICILLISLFVGTVLFLDCSDRTVAKGIGTQSRDNISNPEVAPRIPDARVYDQNGKQLSFYTDLIKGNTVAINFIFTSCTAICPPLTANFRRVQTQIEKQPNVRLISVSVDPTTDVPERLKDYATKFKAGPGWTFVTGDKVEIDKLLVALGTAVANKNDHTPTILIGNDAAGYWTRTYGLSPPARIVEIIKDAADRKATR